MTESKRMTVKKAMQYRTAFVTSALILMSSGYAETSKPSGKELPTIEQHAPHEHGAATLTIAIDANQIEIDLESPADNIFGFEYVPSSNEDKQKVKDAVKQLKVAKTLFTIPDAAQCHLDQVNVSSPMLERTHIENKKETNAHNDVDASWYYSCQSSEQLTSITPHFFSIFSSGFKQLKVEWLTPSGASSRMLRDDEIIKFK